MQLDNIGKWKVFSIDTGTFYLDGGAMMGSVPKVLWEKTNPPDKLNRIELSMRCLLVDDGRNRVLIESGIGDKIDNNFIEMFNIKKEKYSLYKALSDNGYSYKNITHIVLTHLHFDHAGGCTKFNDSNELIASFPNAKYFISKTNWRAALNPNPKDKASYLNENFLILRDSKKLNLIDDNVEIIKGVSTYSVNGHTIGQQLIKISDKDKNLVFCSDLIPLKSHLKLPWIMGYDLNASLTLKEKKIFLDKASDNNWILFLYHDPDIITVRISKSDKYYDVIEEVKYEG